MLCVCSSCLEAAVEVEERWGQGFRGVDPDSSEAQLRHTTLCPGSGPLLMYPLPHFPTSSLSLLTPLVLKDAFQLFFWACFPDPCLLTPMLDLSHLLFTNLSVWLSLSLHCVSVLIMATLSCSSSTLVPGQSNDQLILNE